MENKTPIEAQAVAEEISDEAIVVDGNPYTAPLKHYTNEGERVTEFFHHLVNYIAMLREFAPNIDLVPFFAQIPLIGEFVFQRLVDTFLLYITEQLTIVFTARPEMLSTEEKITYREALEFETKEELVAALVDRKVLSLSFKGLVDLCEYLEQKHGVVFFEKPEDLKRAAILVEKRNLIAHNRGIANQRYLDRVPSATESLGDRLRFDPQEVFADHKFLTEIVFASSRHILDKFMYAAITPKLKSE
jgi:hypothetical protein